MSQSLLQDAKTKLVLLSDLMSAHGEIKSDSSSTPTSGLLYAPSPSSLGSVAKASNATKPDVLVKCAATLVRWQTRVKSLNDGMTEDDLRKVIAKAYEDVDLIQKVSKAWMEWKTKEDNIAAAQPTKAVQDAVMAELNGLQNYAADVKEQKIADRFSEKLKVCLSSSSGKLYKFFRPAYDIMRQVKDPKSIGSSSSAYDEYGRLRNTRDRIDSKSIDDNTRLIEQARDSVATASILDSDADHSAWTWMQYINSTEWTESPDIARHIGTENLHQWITPTLVQYLRATIDALNAFRKSIPTSIPNKALLDNLTKLVNTLATLMDRASSSSNTIMKDICADSIRQLGEFGTTFSINIPEGKKAKATALPGSSNYAESIASTFGGFSAAALKPGGANEDSAAMEAAAKAGVKLGYAVQQAQDGSQVYVSEGMLYRCPDTARMNAYIKAADSFDKAMHESGLTDNVDLITKRATSSVESVVAAISTDAPDEEVLLNRQRDMQAEHLLTVVQGYTREVHGMSARFLRTHSAFSVHHNRSALRYMRYWRTLGLKADQIKRYFDRMDAIVAKAVTDLGTVRQSVESLFTNSIVEQGMTNKQIIRVQEMGSALREYSHRVEERIISMYTGPGPSFLDTFSDPQAITVYALKIVRGITALLAASIASRAFRAIYAQKVYVEQTDPPSPFLFLLMFAGVELGITLVIAGLVFIAARLTASSPDSPINADLVKVWLGDVVMTTCVIYSVAAVLAAVIQRKKYFRYYQEGDRGVRALSTLLLWTYVIILLLPMYRLAI